ncbi:MAG: pancreas/duodenum homeobox protein 1 [Desulfobacteraceae bacterium]|nr:pancreas/duodenum homeobox protein 1 [Desulfobacteraceae bacterium]
MPLNEKEIRTIFTEKTLIELFPADRSDLFFEALFGEAEEGAFDISLTFKGIGDHKLNFDLLLNQRPGKCLACNLTYGLPEVFLRHPIIDIKGLVENIGKLLEGLALCDTWQLERTRELSREQHVVPLTISVSDKQQHR